MLKKVCFPWAAPLILAGCAGIFINPDLAAGRSAAGNFQRLALPPTLPKEDRIYSQIRDGGFVRFPEHDFYWMQGNFIDVYLSAFDSTPSSVAEAPYTGEKDLTRYLGPEGPPLDPAYYLKKMTDQGFAVFQLNQCPAWTAAAFLNSGVRLLSFGLLHVKKRFHHGDSSGRDSVSTVFRRLLTFDILYGYSRLTGPRQQMPGEESKEEYVLEMRSRFNVRCATSGDVIGQALTLHGGHLPGSHRLFEAFYVAIKGEGEVEGLLDSVRANARRLGAGDSLPTLHRLL